MQKSLLQYPFKRLNKQIATLFALLKKHTHIQQHIIQFIAHKKFLKKIKSVKKGKAFLIKSNNNKKVNLEKNTI